MVKRQRVRERVKKKLKSTNKNEEKEKVSKEGNRSDARLQKKLSKRMAFVESLRENKLRQLKHAGVEKRRKGSKDSFSDLNSLADGLDGLLKEQKNQQSQGINALTSKNREKLMVKESARLQQVLKDSRFQADPFAAIYNHLQATMPDPGRMPKASKVSQVSKKTKK